MLPKAIRHQEIIGFSRIIPNYFNHEKNQISTDFGIS